MKPFVYKNVTYEVDDQGLLLDPMSWNEDFAEGMAKECFIPLLTSDHWKIIRYIHDAYAQTGVCPTVFATCKANGLLSHEMQKLFPSGYQRGVCRIAGVHYRARRMPPGAPLAEIAAGLHAQESDKVYNVDVRGFLIDPETWDKNFALHRAVEMKIPEGRLTEYHWRIIEYLRDIYRHEHRIPHIYEICEKCDLALETFEALFPVGYHRGAIKMAGLRYVK
jgi:tRNA 2-thiouridine synthesizing protein E